MPVFHVHLNGKKVSTAGVGQLGVLSATVTWVRRKPEVCGARKPRLPEEELTLTVGGLITPVDENVRWVDRKLKVGDEIRVVVGETVEIDSPRSRERVRRAADVRSQKAYVRKMAKQFGWTIHTGK